MKTSQVENVLALFELFARERSPCTLTALAAKLAMPKSSTFNLIHTLLVRGYLYETRKRGGYYPTRRLLDLAERIAEGDPFLQGIHGYLEELASQTGETALLSVREGADVIYVDVVESASAIRYTAKVGDRRPIHTTSSGNAILASLGPEEWTRVVASLDVAAPEELAAELAAALTRGWSEDWARTVPDVMGIGVPLVCGERRFGLAVAGPIYRMQDRRGELAAAVRAAGSRVQRLYDGSIAPGAPNSPPDGRRSHG